ncbi:MAG: peptide-modifying radical SAM enzyme CbpB, partial [Desulfuromonadaceae bacterium]
MNATKTAANKASSRGIHFNSGNGPSLLPVAIDHPDYIALLDPDAAFWSLIQKDKLGEALSNESAFMQQFLGKRDAFLQEIEALRFGLQPSAVYFNPTDRCNLNCSYCYIPEELRSTGKTMTPEELLKALGILKEYFQTTVPEGLKPQIIFHGAEPLLAREAVFAGIDAYLDDFRFGVQTNGTLLDEEAISFLTERNIGIGLSLDSHLEEICTRTRKTWEGDSVFAQVVRAMDRLKGYANFNVICTVTRENMDKLVELVDFFHQQEVPICMLNPVRCTRQGARDIKPADHEMAEHYFKALDRSYQLYEQT